MSLHSVFKFQNLTRPLSAQSFLIFRLGLGLILALYFFNSMSSGMLHLQYIAPKFFFTYPGFDWVVRPPSWGMFSLYALLGCFSLLMAFSVFPRLAASLLCVGYTYVFLLDVARYQNHIYLILLLSGILVLAPKMPLGHPFFRKNGRTEPMIPTWLLYVLRLQIGVVYFFGGIAKWNRDWLLRAEPMTTWLARDIGSPDSWLLAWSGMPYAISWAGMLLDILMVPALLWNKSRPWALVSAAMFHGCNALLFNISIFPPLMFWATLLFLNPCWPSRLFARLPVLRQFFLVRQSLKDEQQQFRLPAWGSALIVIYVTAQLLIPLRHWVYPGNVSWHEAGHRFSWRMKLREKTGSVKLYWIQEQGTIAPLNPEALLDSRQVSKIIHDPYLLHQLCLKLAEGLRQRGIETVNIRAVTSVSLNNRPAQPLIELPANLAEKHPMGKGSPWVTSLRPLVREEQKQP